MDSTSEPDPDDASETEDGGSDETSRPSSCGNGVLDDGEACDHGPDNGEYGRCNEDCTGLGPHCGDGILDEGEACDDGNEQAGDGCNEDCSTAFSPRWSITAAQDIRDLTVDTNGDVIAVGRQTGGGDSDGWVLKMSADGEAIEELVFDNLGTEQDDSFDGVAIGPDGAAWMSGTATQPSVSFLRRAFEAESFFESSYPGTYAGLTASSSGAFVLGAAFDGGSVTHYDGDAGFRWMDVAPEDQCAAPQVGPVSTMAGHAMFACVGDDDQWYLHRYASSGHEMATTIDPPDAIRAIAIGKDDELYLAGGAHIGRYELDAGFVWTLENVVDGETTVWNGLAVTPDGLSVIAVGRTEDEGHEVIGAASRITASGDVVAATTVDGLYAGLDDVALGPAAEVYVSGSDGGAGYVLARLAE